MILTLLCKRHQICFDIQNIKVRQGVTSSFDVLTGQNQAIFILKMLAESQHNHDVSQWAVFSKSKGTKCLPVLTEEQIILSLVGMLM